MNEEMIKIFGILVVSFFIIYVVMKMFHPNVEGMTNQTTSTSTSGEAGTATSYAAAIKANVVKLQDELLIPKYRKDYESVIINLDDYVGYLMLQQILNLNTSNDVKSNLLILNNLNTLNASKDSLNATMSFLDKQ
jgi:hypothetical protein